MADTKPLKFPGQSTEAHPEIFTVPPKAGKEQKLGQFTEKQLEQFFKDGYVIIEDYFSKDELSPVRSAVERQLNDFANYMYKNGKIEDLHEKAGMFQRLNEIEAEYPGSTILMIKRTCGSLAPEFQDLFASTKVLNLMEQLLGTQDIIGHPVWNLRCKTPRNEPTTVPWHQDIGYLDNRAYKVLQPTAWIPLLDANENNGCMQMVKGGHRTGRIATHQCCHGGTWYVMLEEDEMERTLDVSMKSDVVTCSVPYGGVLFFNNLIPHRSLNNLSNDTRWSLDLRWQRADQPVGFYDLKQGVRLRNSENPNHLIDWDTFNGIDRNKASDEYLHAKIEEFDTAMSGPWMKKWEIVHVNEHTRKLESEEQSDSLPL